MRVREWAKIILVLVLRILHICNEGPLTIDLFLIRRREWAVLKKYLQLEYEDRVLDIACGRGHWTNLAARSAHSTMGMDLDGDAVLEANASRLNSSIHFQIGNAELLPYKDNSFDKIMSICAFEHFGNDESAFREISRTLKRNGVAAISMASLTKTYLKGSKLEEHCKKQSILRQYRIEELKTMLRDIGLNIADYEYIFTSYISLYLFKLSFHYIKWFWIFFPLTYPISVLADTLAGRKAKGHILCIKVEKQS